MTYLSKHPSSDPPDALPSPEEAPPVRTVADLHQRWRSIMGTEGFDERSVWLIWFDEGGTQLPVMVPLDGLPEHLDEATLSGFITIAGVMRNNGARSLAMALSRPGPGDVTEVDARLARTLLGASRSLDLEMWPMHLATRNSVRQFTVDDLV